MLNNKAFPITYYQSHLSLECAHHAYRHLHNTWMTKRGRIIRKWTHGIFCTQEWRGRNVSLIELSQLFLTESPYKYESGEVNIHYRTPVRLEQKESIPEEELARRQEEHMKKVYENERRKKYLAELEDIERRRHTDNFTWVLCFFLFFFIFSSSCIAFQHTGFF